MREDFLLRRLDRSDAAPYPAIRLEALREHPEAFGASYEEEAAQPVAAYERRVMIGEVCGGFVAGTLMGIARFSIEVGAKRRHIGLLTGMYVRPPARGSGLASALVDAVVAAATGRVELLRLAATAGNERALRLYRRHGFEIYATEPRALKLGDRYFDEVLMMRPIAPA